MSYIYDRDHIRLVTGIVLSDAQKIQATNFFREVQNLDESTWVREGMKAGLTIRMGSADEAETHFRDWEQMQSVLMRLRPLLLQEELTNFESVRKMLVRNVYEQLGRERGRNFNQAVKYQTRGFEGSSSEEGVVVNGTINISSRQFLMDYLYSREFHRNPTKASLIKPSLQMSEQEIQGFLSITVFHIVNAIHILCDILRYVIDEETRRLLE